MTDDHLIRIAFSRQQIATINDGRKQEEEEEEERGGEEERRNIKAWNVNQKKKKTQKT